MADKRPRELVEHNEAATKNNDAVIGDALAKLEEDHAGVKFKATVATLCALTGLSRNTIRNREWALKRLSKIKTARRAKREAKPDVVGASLAAESSDEFLRAQLGRVLSQNALLYDEILYLRAEIARCKREIQTLKRPVLKSI